MKYIDFEMLNVICHQIHCRHEKHIDNILAFIICHFIYIYVFIIVFVFAHG